MKISFLIPTFGSGGAERTIEYVASYMANCGHDVEIISITNTKFYDPDKRVKFVTMDVDGHYRNILGRIANIVKRYYRIGKHIKKSQPDVVCCLLPETAKFVLSLCKKKKIKLITSERNNPALDGNSSLKNKIFEKSDGIIFQTERAREWYPERIRSKGVVIHNAVGNKLVYDVPEQRNTVKTVSAVGRLSPQKDYPTMLRAFKLVLDKHSDFVLNIFGKGADLGALTALASELGISEKIVFKGECKDAIMQIADSACYVMSSAYEGMPNALMEAMAIGLPCVSTDCPNGPAELINSGKNGLLVPVGDAKALADAICKMIDDRDFAKTCGENAKKILEDHSIPQIAKKYTDYIESICS